MSVDHPVIESALIPLVLGFALAGVMRVLGVSGLGDRSAAAAIPVAVLTAYWLTFGMPSWPPAGGLAKWPLVVGLCLLGALVTAYASLSMAWMRGLAIAALFLALAWVAWPLVSNGSLASMIGVGALMLGGGVVLWRTVRGSEVAPSVEPLVMLVVASAGLAGVALMSASLSIAQMAGALAAAAGGVALWNWPVARFAFGTEGAIGAVIPLVSLAGLVMVSTNAPSWVLLPLALVFFADDVSDRLPVVSRRLGPVLRPLATLMVAAVLAAFAVALATLASTGGEADLYYR
jgi:hypothetical protein